MSSALETRSAFKARVLEYSLSWAPGLNFKGFELRSFLGVRSSGVQVCMCSGNNPALVGSRLRSGWESSKDAGWEHSDLGRVGS